MAPTARSRSSLAGRLSPFTSESPSPKFQRRGSVDANTHCKLYESTVASRGKCAPYVRLQRAQQRRSTLEECWSEATINPYANSSLNVPSTWTDSKLNERSERPQLTSPMESKTPVPHMMNNPMPLTSIPPLLPSLMPPPKSFKSRSSPSPIDRSIALQSLAGSCPNFANRIEEDEGSSGTSTSSTSSTSNRSTPNQIVRGTGGLLSSAGVPNLNYMYGGGSLNTLERTQSAGLTQSLVGFLRAPETPTSAALSSPRATSAATCSPRPTRSTMSYSGNPYERSSTPAPASTHSSASCTSSTARAHASTPVAVASAPAAAQSPNFSNLQAVFASRPALVYSKQIMYAGRRRLLHSHMLQLRSRLRLSLPAIAEERWSNAQPVLLVSV